MPASPLDGWNTAGDRIRELVIVEDTSFSFSDSTAEPNIFCLTSSYLRCFSSSSFRAFSVRSSCVNCCFFGNSSSSPSPASNSFVSRTELLVDIFAAAGLRVRTLMFGVKPDCRGTSLVRWTKYGVSGDSASSQSLLFSSNCCCLRSAFESFFGPEHFFAVSSRPCQQLSATLNWRQRFVNHTHLMVTCPIVVPCIGNAFRRTHRFCQTSTFDSDSKAAISTGESIRKEKSAPTGTFDSLGVRFVGAGGTWALSKRVGD